MRVAWLTDIHLNFVARGTAQRFLQKIRRQTDAVLITGDIAEAPSLEMWLTLVADELGCPVYFCLGNHDFYDGGWDAVREVCLRLSQDNQQLIWLDQAGVVRLSAETALVGAGGWADARLGDWSLTSTDPSEAMTDWEVIDDLCQLAPDELRSTMQQWADSSAEYVAAHLELACQQFERVVVGTHVPPFAEAALYRGLPSSDASLPNYTNHAMGNVLMAAAKKHSGTSILVLAGHTHGRARFRPLLNLECRVGAAVYGSPRLQQPVFSF